MEQTIILLHGMNCNWITMLGICIYLKKHNFIVHNIDYDASGTLDECVDSASNSIYKIIKNKRRELTVIGQSLGGLVATRLYTKGWNVVKIITIASPLNGARLLTKVKENIPILYNTFNRKIYNDLEQLSNSDNKSIEYYNIPKCDIYTISTSLPFTNFDGYLYVDETKLDDSKHFHIPYCDHRLINFNPKLYKHIYNILKSK